MIFFSLLLSGCTNNEDKAQEILHTAQFEVQQFAEERAEKLFKTVITQYPQTKAAKTAKEELAKLKKQKTEKRS